MSCPTQSFCEDGGGEKGEGGVEINSRSIHILKINFKTSHSKLQEHQDHIKFANCLWSFLRAQSCSYIPPPPPATQCLTKASTACRSHIGDTMKPSRTVTSTCNSEMTGLLKAHHNEELTVLSCVHIMQKPPKRHLGLAAPLWLGESDSGNLALPKAPLVLRMVSWK